MQLGGLTAAHNTITASISGNTFRLSSQKGIRNVGKILDRLRISRVTDGQLSVDISTAVFGILDINYILTDIIQTTSFYVLKDYHLLDLFHPPIL